MADIENEVGGKGAGQESEVGRRKSGAGGRKWEAGNGKPEVIYILFLLPISYLLRPTSYVLPLIPRFLNLPGQLCYGHSIEFAVIVAGNDIKVFQPEPVLGLVFIFEYDHGSLQVSR